MTVTQIEIPFQPRNNFARFHVFFQQPFFLRDLFEIRRGGGRFLSGYYRCKPEMTFGLLAMSE